MQYDIEAQASQQGFGAQAKQCNFNLTVWLGLKGRSRPATMNCKKKEKKINVSHIEKNLKKVIFKKLKKSFNFA